MITVGSIHGGTQANVIPDEVRLQLSVRTYTDEVRTRTFAAIRRVAKGEATAAGAPKEPLVETPERGNPPVYNDPALTSRLAGALKKGLGDAAVVEMPAKMTSEDFSEYGLAGVPSALLHVGAVIPRSSPPHVRAAFPCPHHTHPSGHRSANPRSRARFARRRLLCSSCFAEGRAGPAFRTRHRESARFMVATHGTVSRTARSMRPRSRPIDWSLHQHRHGVRVPSVKRRRQIAKGALGPGARARRLLWSWWPWAIACVGFIVYDRLGWALGTGVMALLSYLTTPAAAPAAIRALT